MKRSKFTEAQIAFVLKQAEEGTPVAEVCRKAGISDATFYNWRKLYGGLMPYWVACDLSDPERTLLGPTQENWLKRGYGIAQAKWNLIVQSTQLTPFRREDEGVTLRSSDRWDGFPAARQRLFDMIKSKAAPNPTLIGGDIHAFLSTSLVEEGSAALVANELVTAAISSGGGGGDRYLAETTPYESWGRPFFFENRRNGYLLCTLDANALRADARVVDSVLDPDAGSQTLRTFIYEAGRLGPTQV